MIKHSCHFSIQINRHYIMVFAPIAGLQTCKSKRVLRNLTNDFGCMTNEILKLSDFYKAHSFVINQEQKDSKV